MVEAVSSPAAGREQIKNELIALAQEHLNNWENYTDRQFQSSEYGFDFTSHQTEFNGMTMTISKAVVPNVTI